jgi:CubicO group peptidase (beta-lactamase class C family)
MPSRSLLALVILAGCASAPVPSCPEPESPAASAAASPAAHAAASAPSASPEAPTTLPAVARFDVEPDAAMKRVDAKEAGLDPAALDDLVREAERTKSDALLVIVDGKVVVERYFGKPRSPIETMSATKSVVSMAIGRLVADGKIASVDVPLSTFFPDWRQGRKAKVTLKHVLTHTSGLEHGKGAGNLNKQKDRLAFVRKSAIVEEPGEKFSYNNEATQLLAGVVKAASGKPLDAYVAETIFAPLGIVEWQWAKDDAGNVQAFYGLALHARDLAKLGQVMLDKGRYGDARILPEQWVVASSTEAVPRSGHGLLWWLRYGPWTLELTTAKLDELKAAGFGAGAKLAPLVGKRYTTGVSAFWMDVGARLEESERASLAAVIQRGIVPVAETPGPVIGFAADGWLGQHLLVIPDRRIVVVRQHREPKGQVADDAYNQAVGFFSLAKMMDRAARR